MRIRKSLGVSYSFAVGVLLVVSGIAWGNLSTGTWVRLTFGKEDDPIFVGNIFTLGTFSTLHDFWVSGAKSTALVTGVTTGGLPYLVAFGLGVAWFCPLRDVERRFLSAGLMQAVRLEHMLTYAAILLCVALKSDVPVGPTDLKIRTIFGWGTFSFELANVMAYVLCVVLAYEQRMATFNPPPLLRSLKPHKLLHVLLILNVVLTVSLALPSIRFTTRELAGDYVTEKRREFSVWSTAVAIAGSTRRAQAKAFWTVWLAAITVVIPVLSTLLLCALFWMPASYRPDLFVAALHAHATAAADAWFVVLANFASEVSLISSWIVDQQIKHICKDIKRNTHYDGCAVVTGYPLAGFWVLLAFCLLNNFLYFLLYAAIYKDSLYPSIATRLPLFLVANHPHSKTRPRTEGDDDDGGDDAVVYNVLYDDDDDEEEQQQQSEGEASNKNHHPGAAADDDDLML